MFSKQALQATFFLAVLFSCSKKNEELVMTPQEKQDFYPIDLGNYWIYNVKESVYSGGLKQDAEYTLKEALSDTFLDETGHISYKLVRYKKPLDVDTFQLDSTWSAHLLDENKVIVIENNVPYLKLFYPLALNSTWNGNMYNNYPAESYSVTEIGVTKGIYSSIAVVTHRNDTNLLYRDYRVELFAKEIGKVYKETRTLTFSNNAQDFGKGIIFEGFVQTQQLVGYGKE